jgi:hypothetical protein
MEIIYTTTIHPIRNALTREVLFEKGWVKKSKAKKNLDESKKIGSYSEKGLFSVMTSYTKLFFKNEKQYEEWIENDRMPLDNESDSENDSDSDSDSDDESDSESDSEDDTGFGIDLLFSETGKKRWADIV